MNPKIALLQPYPFEKLNALKAGITPPSHLSHIALSIGEPKHTPPQFVLDSINDNINRIANYPVTKGMPELRAAIATWLNQRFGADVNPETQILPASGTREALFSFAQSVIDPNQHNATVVMPNPFYQIYEGAALLAGAKPYFLNCTTENHFIPDFDQVPQTVWEGCQLIYLCSPGNPTGAVIQQAEMEKLIALSDQYDFIIASDECYSEIYNDEEQPPVGLLEVCTKLGRTDYKNCVVFNSLSKRSNLAGLRSGFVAGDAALMSSFLTYRTYHGSALPGQTQVASIAAWQDEQHVAHNRTLYRDKFSAVIEILKDTLPVTMPEASFFLWPETPIADTEFAQRLFAEQNVTVLPGSYLARNTEQANGSYPTTAEQPSVEQICNPGKNHVRMALVANLEECVDAAHRIKQFTQSLK